MGQGHFGVMRVVGHDDLVQGKGRDGVRDLKQSSIARIHFEAGTIQDNQYIETVCLRIFIYTSIAKVEKDASIVFVVGQAQSPGKVDHDNLSQILGIRWGRQQGHDARS